MGDALAPLQGTTSTAILGGNSKPKQRTGPIQSPARFYRPELDGLRFIAFLAVLVHHAVPPTFIEAIAPRFPKAAPWVVALCQSGAFGTDLFFALSSYLITVLLLHEQRACGRLDVLRFYARRVLRIWPLYFAFLLAAIFLIPHWVPSMALDHRYETAFLLFGANWACALWGFPHSLAGPLWSVSIEEQFYLVWPFVILWARGGRALINVALAMLAISTVTQIVFASLKVSADLMWFSTPTRLEGIACGLLAAIVFDSGHWKERTREWKVLSLVSLLALVTLVRYLGETPAAGVWTYPTAALCCLATLRWVLGVGDESFLARAPFVYLGKISYGLYVFHFLTISIATRILPWASPELYYPTRAAIALAFAVGLASASYYLLERPFLKLKARFALVPSRPAI